MVVQTDPVPLTADGFGGLTVGDTRVALEVVLEDFEAGSSPEAIVEHFPILKLADVYAVIAYFLRHREEVEAYLRASQEEAEAARLELMARQEPQLGMLHARIRERWAARERLNNGSDWPLTST
jgi:uncharacterized protein (DUF433 family)